MAGFIIYMLAAFVWGLAFGRITRRVPNLILIRCSTCGSRLYQRPSTKRWRCADTMAWAFVAWMVVWRHHFPHLVAIAFALVLLVAWMETVQRVVHAYWMWRHPLRCQGGGHFNPVPQGT